MGTCEEATMQQTPCPVVRESRLNNGPANVRSISRLPAGRGRTVRSKNSTDRKARSQSGFERISEFVSRPNGIVVARSTGGFEAISIARRVRRSRALMVSSPVDGSHAAFRW